MRRGRQVIGWLILLFGVVGLASTGSTSRDSGEPILGYISLGVLFIVIGLALIWWEFFMKSRVRVGLLAASFVAPAALIVYGALSLRSEQQQVTLGSAPEPQQASTSAPSTTPSDTGGSQRA